MRLFPVPDNNFGIIARKQKVEAERLARIFDPKMRIKGVDINAVVEEIHEKEQKAIEEKRQKLLYGNFSPTAIFICSEQATNEMNSFMNSLDENLKQIKTRNLHQLNEDRKNQYRDDPLAPRVIINDGKSHTSGCKEFIGHDLDRPNRERMQREQMKTWVQEQMYEKSELKRIKKEQEINYRNYQNALNSAMDEIVLKQTQLKKEQLRRDYEYNTILQEFHKEQQSEERKNLAHFDGPQLRHSRLGEMIYETKRESHSNIKEGGLCSEYKGMGEQELATYRAGQEKQRQQKEEAIRKHKEDESKYHQYQKEILAFNALLDAKKIEIVKEQNKLQFQMNGIMVQSKRTEIEKSREMKQVYEPQAFFASFNKSTR